MADAGLILAGPIGREIFGAAQMLFLVFVMGSHILTFSIMFNTLTNHGTCTIVFGFVGMLLSLLCTLPRTLLNVSYMAMVSFVSIIGSVLITMIGVGVERPGDGKVDVTVKSSLAKGFLATANIVFAYSGIVILSPFLFTEYSLLAPRSCCLLLVHLRIQKTGNLSQSSLPSPGSRRQYVSDCRSCDIPLRRHRRRFSRPWLSLPGSPKSCLWYCYPYYPCRRCD